MIVESTTEAEVMAAAAVYCWYYFCEVLALDRTFDGVLAIGSRAPFEVFAIVNVGSCEKDLVSVERWYTSGETR
jgi:hypothetical protein